MRTFYGSNRQQREHQEDDHGGAGNDPAHGYVALNAAGGIRTWVRFLCANVLEAGSQGGNDRGHGANQGNQSGGGHGSRGHWADVLAPHVVGGHQRNGNCGRIDRRVSRELPKELNRRHHQQPGDHAAREKNSRHFRTDDVAHSQVFRGNRGAERSSREPAGAHFRLAGPRLHGVHQEGIHAAETKSPKHASGKRASALPGHQNVGASRAFGKGQVAVLFDDQLAPQRDHEQDAEPASQQRQGENPPEGKFRAEAQKNQRRQREHYARGKRFSRGTGGLHDVVFEDGRAAERAQDADREHRDGNRSRNREPRAQADIHADRAKQQAKQRTKDHRADGEFHQALFRRDVGAKFSGRRSGTPGSLANCGFFAHRILLGRESKLARSVSGDYAAA